MFGGAGGGASGGMGGLGSMGMGGILPMLMSGQSMGLIPMLMGQGQGGQGQNQPPQDGQQPASWLQPQRQGGFAPSLANFLQGRYGR